MDCYVEDPMGNIIYRETKKQYDSFTYKTEVKGVYRFCFSNEFSTFSHKTVYFDFQVGDEPPILPDMGNRVTALTQVSGHDRNRRALLSACSCFFVLVLAGEPDHHLAVKDISGLLFLVRALLYLPSPPFLCLSFFILKPWMALLPS